ncbi:MAG: hypothetical protein ACLPWS_07000 [Rhodomicrobium sp.]
MLQSNDLSRLGFIKAKPFGVIEAARLCFVFEFLKPLREAMKTKCV